VSDPAAIVGFFEFPPLRFSATMPGTSLEQAAELTLRALADAGLGLRDLNGLVCQGLYVTELFKPSTLAEYLGAKIQFGEVPDLGGASAVGMVWRAASAIALGLCDVVVCVVNGGYPPPKPDGEAWNEFGASSYNFGSPQAEFEIPYGHLGQNVPYAFIAQRYGYEHGYDGRAMARLVACQRRNGAVTPHAIHFGQPVTEDDVLASPMIAPPLHLLEIVRPVKGGAALVVASAEAARRCRHPPAYVVGFGEAVTHKSPHYAPDMLWPPLATAARQAFAMAGVGPRDMDAAQIYDCYTIATLLALETAGFAPRGEGQRFIKAHNLGFHGDFPLNTNGGQLGFGQPGGAGGMVHLIEGARQASRRAGDRQVDRCRQVFVSGNGGIMSEQSALILRGDL
jgi:acetyl-CoA acetyltransferase